MTSPPYWGLRDYGVDGQIGLESALDAYVETMVAVGRELWRVLKPSGTFWLNLGDCYATGAGKVGARPGGGAQGDNWQGAMTSPNRMPQRGLKPKDLCGVPWRVAFALQAEGWWLRSAIVWAKPNPMPESITDRPTSAYEMVFLLTKSERYFYDADAIAEGAVSDHKSGNGYKRPEQLTKGGRGQSEGWDNIGGSRNARNIWTIATRPFKGSHFATMPPDLAERCIKAGCPAGGQVLDPFGGAGTTGLVADRLGRHATLIELNPSYGDMGRDRIEADAPLLSSTA